MTHLIYKNASTLIMVVAMAVAMTCAVQLSAQDDKKEADTKAQPKAETKKDAAKDDAKTDDAKKDDAKDDAKKDDPKDPPKESPYKTLKEKISYIVGLNIGNLLKNQNVEPSEIDTKIILQGVEDACAGEETKLNALQRQTALLEYRKFLDGKGKKAEEEAKKKLAAENAKKGAEYLEKIKKDKKDKIKSTDSGILYEVLVEGKGKSPKPTDTVVAHYVGTHIDGREFDSSRKREEPYTFRLNRMIPGWIEALQLMKEGGRWKIYLPSKVAYGEDGSPPAIGPNETLVFDVELIEVKGTLGSDTGDSKEDKK